MRGKAANVMCTTASNSKYTNTTRWYDPEVKGMYSSWLVILCKIRTQSLVTAAHPNRKRSSPRHRQRAGKVRIAKPVAWDTQRSQSCKFKAMYFLSPGALLG